MAADTFRMNTNGNTTGSVAKRTIAKTPTAARRSRAVVSSPGIGMRTSVFRIASRAPSCASHASRSGSSSATRRWATFGSFVSRRRWSRLTCGASDRHADQVHHGVGQAPSQVAPDRRHQHRPDLLAARGGHAERPSDATPSVRRRSPRCPLDRIETSRPRLARPRHARPSCRPSELRSGRRGKSPAQVQAPTKPPTLTDAGTIRAHWYGRSPLSVKPPSACHGRHCLLAGTRWSGGGPPRGGLVPTRPRPSLSAPIDGKQSGRSAHAGSRPG